MNRIYVLKNRKRFYAFMILITITLSCVLLSDTVSGANIKEKYITVTVEKGDTLWDISCEYNVKGDIRHYISRIKKINNIPGSMIYEGDILRIPV